MMARFAMPTVVLPKNNVMQDIVRRGEGKGDDGTEVNKSIGELNVLNCIRVVADGVTFGVSLVEMSS